jgi:hypothetical protein
MANQLPRGPSRFALALVLGAVTALVFAQEKQPSSCVERDCVIAGTPQDSLEVRHLILRGSNTEIGKALAQIAQERYQVRLLPSEDALRTRAQRRYLEKNYPILYDRMRGVAASFGRPLEDDHWNYSWLSISDLRAGCSVIHLPPNCMSSGTSLVSRDYDFTTGSFGGGPLAAGKLHPTARPYLVELHPDRGYPSIAMVAYDLLSGVLDGMNSEGLTVALLADDELIAKSQMEPTGAPQAGLGVLQVPRMLLDTCANVEEAKDLLLQTKQYYEAVPVHYLIADRFGKAFIWEHSFGHNREFIIENPNLPLVTTNFSLHRHLEKDRPPSAEQARKVCPRYCLLTESLAQHPGKMSEEFIKQTHQKVDAVQPKSPISLRPPNRTFWHALYCPEERRLRISFYLRDEPAPEDPNKVRIIRSSYQEFRLRQ